MEMHVLDLLPRVRADIGENPVAALGYPRFPRHGDDELEEPVPFAVLPQAEIVRVKGDVPGG